MNSLTTLDVPLSVSSDRLQPPRGWIGGWMDRRGAGWLPSDRVRLPISLWLYLANTIASYLLFRFDSDINLFI